VSFLEHQIKKGEKIRCPQIIRCMLFLYTRDY